MARPLMGKKLAHILAFILFAIGVAILTHYKIWWPALILVLGLPVALKHYLLGEFFETFLALFIFFGLYITFKFQFKPDILLPVFVTLGGIYIFFKEFFPGKKTSSQKPKLFIKKTDDENDDDNDLEDDVEDEE